MVSDNESAKSIAQKDLIDQELESLTQQGLIQAGEFILNPKQERIIGLLNKKLTDAEETIASLKKQIQFFQERLGRALLKGEYDSPGKEGKAKTKPKPMSRDDLLKALKGLQDSQELDILKRKLAESQEQLKQAAGDRDRLAKEFQDYKDTQDEILTDYQADAAIQKKIKELHALRGKLDVTAAKVAKLDGQYQRTATQIEQQTTFYNEVLVPRYNAKVQLIKALDEQILQKRAELGRFRKLRPLPPPHQEETKPGDSAKSSSRPKRWLGGLLHRK